MNLNSTLLRRVVIAVACAMLFPAVVSAQGLKTATLFEWNFETPTPEYLSKTYRWSPQQIEQYRQLVDAAIQQLNAHKASPSSNTGMAEFFGNAKQELATQLVAILTPEQAQAWQADWDADDGAIKTAKTLYNEYYTKEIVARSTDATYAPLAALRTEYIARIGNIVGAQYAELMFEELALNKMVRTNKEIVLLQLPYQTAKEYARRTYKYENELAMLYSEPYSRTRRTKQDLIKSQYEGDAGAILGVEKDRQRERLKGSAAERWLRDRFGLNDTQIEACKTLRNNFAAKAYKIRHDELTAEEKAAQIREAITQLRQGMQGILTSEQYSQWITHRQNQEAKRKSRGMQ